MKMLKLTGLAALAAVLPFCAAQAQLNTNVTFTSVNVSIPDGNPVGLSSSTNLSGIYGGILNVTVTLDITGGFNGDLYAYLAGPSGGFAVLLNRTGITAGNSFGYSDTGFNVTFDDSAANNIHLYQNDSPNYNVGGQLINAWQPDGRNIDPQSSPSTFDSTSPTADLSSFNGNSANGAWTLFVADLSSGGQGTLVSWGLTVVTVPEPQTWVLIAGGVGLLLAVNLRRKL